MNFAISLLFLAEFNVTFLITDSVTLT